MSDDDCLKNLSMLPSELHISARETAHRIEHARLNEGGDLTKRTECCDLRSEAFPEGKKVADIPELSKILKPTGYLLNEYFPAYRRIVCGQEWFQDWEQLKFGGNIHVRKARP